MKEEKGVFLTVFLIMLLIPLFSFASYPVMQYPNVTPMEKMHPNGKYVVYVEKGSKWQEAGSIYFDKYFREKEIDLTDYISSDNTIKVRLLQQGGGAAHIDSVSFGEKSPIDVKGIENGLQKLSKQDFDVVDAFNKSMEITFPTNSDNRILKLTARVENTKISKIPFQFPIANLYKEMSLKSKFYTYELGTKKTDSPLFQEYSLAGSGHPSGYTYGWVRHDNENIYVKIDFTPDNTMDGNKDYAAVYVKTDRGIKEFKVSMQEKTWGAPTFTYTDKVDYQHKVYEFKIPLSDIFCSETPKKDDILLAFAAYGTASPNTFEIFLHANPATSQPFSYTSDLGNFNLVDDNDTPGFDGKHIINSVSVGVHTITQTSGPAGYVLNTIECQITGGGPGTTDFNYDFPNKSVTITYAAGDGVYCVFTNSTGALYLGDPVDSLYSVNTTTAGVSFIGAGECEGLAPSGDSSFLYCVNNNDTLYTIATATGVRTIVGSMGGANSTGDRGLAYNTTTGILYGSDLTRFGSINTSTGEYTALATHPSESIDCLAANPNQNVIYGVDWGGSLYIYNVGTNSWAFSSLDTGLDGDGCGLAFDPNEGILYFVESSTGNLYSINPNSLIATVIGDTGLTYPFGLAFVGEPPSVSIPTLTQWGMIVFVVLTGLGAVYYLRRKKRAE
ncbi:MAG: hypothetical protein KGZ88_02490 [Methylomicrobium sp.]|nr:hypothetical protein [Methylomicrobium sp.]